MANFTVDGRINANRAAEAYQELSKMVEGRNYNLGELVLDNGKLTKVNHHASGWFANNRVTTDTENKRVREAVNAAIRQHWAGATDEKKALLDEISKHLVGDGFKSQPLTRREVCAYLKVMSGEVKPHGDGKDQCVAEIHKAEHGFFGYYRDGLNKFKLSKYTLDHYTLNQNMLGWRDVKNKYDPLRLAVHLGGIMRDILEVSKKPLSNVEVSNKDLVKKSMGKLLGTMLDVDSHGQNFDQESRKKLLGSITDATFNALLEKAHYHQLSGDRGQQLRLLQRSQVSQGLAGIANHRLLSPDKGLGEPLGKLGFEVLNGIDDAMTQMSGEIATLSKYLGVSEKKCQEIILSKTQSRIETEFAKLKDDIGVQLLMFIKKNKIDDCDVTTQGNWLKNGVIDKFDGFLAEMTQKINEFTDRVHSFGDLEGPDGVRAVLRGMVHGQHSENMKTINNQPLNTQKVLIEKEIKILNEFGVSEYSAKDRVAEIGRVLGESGDERELKIEDDLANKFDKVLKLEGQAADAYFEKLAFKLSKEYKQEKLPDDLTAGQVKAMLVSNFGGKSVNDLKIQIRENLENIRRRLGDAMVKAGVDFDLLLEHVDVGYLMTADTTLAVLKDSLWNMAGEIREKLYRESPTSDDLAAADKMITALEQMKSRFDKVIEMSEGVAIPKREDDSNLKEGENLNALAEQDEVGSKFKLTDKLIPVIEGLFAKQTGSGRYDAGNHRFAGRELYEEDLVIGQNASKSGGSTEDMGEIYRQMRKQANKFISGTTGKSVKEQKAIVNDFIVNQINKLKKMGDFLYVFAKNNDGQENKEVKLDLVKLRQDLNNAAIGRGVRRENVAWKHQNSWNEYVANFNTFANRQMGKGLSGWVEGGGVNEMNEVRYDFTTDWK